MKFFCLVFACFYFTQCYAISERDSFLRTHLILYATDEFFREEDTPKFKEKHLIAATVVELWLKLPIMEEVDKLLHSYSKGIIKVAISHEFDPVELMFKNLQTAFLSHPVLHDHYAKMKKITSTMSYNFKRLLPRKFTDKIDDLLLLPKARKVILSSFFLIYSRVQHPEKLETKLQDQHSLPMAILLLAKKYVCADELQQIYDSALANVSESFDTYAKLDSAFAELYLQVKTGIEKNCTLNTLLRTVAKYALNKTHDVSILVHFN